MILSSILFLAVHVDGGDAEIASLGLRHADSRSSVPLAIDCNCSAPALIFLDSLAHVLDKVIVVWVSGSIVGVQVLFEVLTRGPIVVRVRVKYGGTLTTYKS